MNKEKRFKLKTRVAKILDVVYDRTEELILKSKREKLTNDVLMGRVSGVLTDACNSIDTAIDVIGGDK